MKEENHEDEQSTFSTALLIGAAASLISTRGIAANATPEKARNVVLVHGLFADGSCWSEVIPRLQTAGLNVTSVQNPLTTLPEAVASAERVLARQDGPTVLVGHSFSGMIVTEAGVHPNVSHLAGCCGNRRNEAIAHTVQSACPRRQGPAWHR
jgi:pimeloyl-ACP methyl ester carboxylesterase